MPPVSAVEQERSAALRRRIEPILGEITRRELASDAVALVSVLGLEQWGGSSSRSDPVELADMGLKTLIEGRDMLTRNLDRWDAILDYRENARPEPPEPERDRDPEPEPEELDVVEPEPEPEPNDGDEKRDEPGVIARIEPPTVLAAPSELPYMTEFFKAQLARAQEHAESDAQTIDELRAALAEAAGLVAGVRDEYVSALLSRLAIATGDEHSEIADRVERALGIG